MKPKSRILARILLILLVIPAGALCLALILGVMIIDPLQATGIYISASDALIAIFLLMPVVAFGFYKRWTGSTKIGNRIFKIGAGAFIAFLVVATLFSTASTNNMVEIANRVTIPAGFDRVIAENAINDDDLTPDSLLPCLDLQADGCPSMNRTWERAEADLLYRADLEKLIKENGLDANLTIKDENCREDDGQAQERRSCWAYGSIDGYDAYLNTTNSYGSPSITLSLREPSEGIQH